MYWFLRPSILILVSVALAVSAAVLVLLPLWEENRKAGRPVPLPVAADEREIVWLYAANNAAPWERFVTAMGKAANRLNADPSNLQVMIDDASAFPRETATVPQLTLKVAGQPGKLVFRWYKLTSTSKTKDWAEALMERQPPPLAIIGGSSSDLAIDLANSLQEETKKNQDAKPPLILLTNATADRVLEGDDPAAILNNIHPGRTFRFCFTNSQMAEAITQFIWKNDDLRPDCDPVYVAMWKDDAYSQDLTGRFFKVLRRLQDQRGAPESVPISEYIDYSVGMFEQPNRWEGPVVKRIMETKIRDYPYQKRPLLILPAASSQPARRFLRGLVRTSPVEARRFVVATGDGLSFNNIYRDRNVTWPIQDLPFDLVFFCHRNPVDPEAGFQAEGNFQPGDPNKGSPATGTEDLLLNRDIVEALTLAMYHGADLPVTGDALAERLHQARWENMRIAFTQKGEGKSEGKGPHLLLFDKDGNRRSGTGEHLVWLRPSQLGKEVQPEATLEVWTLDSPRPVQTMTVTYETTRSDR